MMNFLYIKPPNDTISKYFTLSDNTWRDIPSAAEALSHIKFFNRYNKSELIKDILPRAKLRIYDKDQIIFTNNNEVSVIWTGEVVWNSHKENTFPFKILAKYNQGDIIGSGYDTKSTLDFKNWWITRNKTITLYFTCEDFERIWIKQETIEKINTTIFIENYKLFKPLSIQSRYKILDLLESRIYKAGSLILPQSKSSKYNLDYVEFNNPNLNFSGKKQLKDR